MAYPFQSMVMPAPPKQPINPYQPPELPAGMVTNRFDPSALRGGGGGGGMGSPGGGYSQYWGQQPVMPTLGGTPSKISYRDWKEMDNLERGQWRHKLFKEGKEAGVFGGPVQPEPKIDFLGAAFGGGVVPPEVKKWYDKVMNPGVGRPPMANWKSVEEFVKAMRGRFPAVQLADEFDDIKYVKRDPPNRMIAYGGMMADPSALGGYGRQPL